ncbi:DUF481 domain-containing protein [Balneolales bacterium ANBcel1]|nr:DUF481 domain-containing protein [Balneolales bacterium ANBcel1]
MRHFSTSLFLCTLTFFLMDPADADAQVVNVERHRVQADTFNVWTGGLGFGLSVSKSANQVVRLNTTSDLTYVAKKHDFLFIARNNFLRVEGENVMNDGYAHLRAVLFRDNTLAPEVFLQAQYNLDWGLARRTLAGSNVRIRLHETDSFSAFVSTGLMFENEIWKDEDEDLRDVRNLLKSTTSFNLRGRLTDSVDLAAISYYQARPDRFFKPRFTSDWQVRFRISENLRFALQFVSTFDSDPPLNSTEFIYNINNILEVRF